MVSYEVMGGPLADASVWRGALLWAIALYMPLSAPLSKLESSLEDSDLPESVRQPTLVISSLLLALVTGVVTPTRIQLGPGSRLGLKPWRGGRGLECFAHLRQYRQRGLIQEAPARGSAANSSGT